jgi:Fe-Mn family superoxide dismutase
MELHHSKHHNTYITNLNVLVSTLHAAKTADDIPTQLSLQPALRFHAGGHINHSLFWLNLAPPSSPETAFSSAPRLGKVIVSTWGSEDGFVKEFNKQLLGIMGSGWGWLVKFENEGGRLGIVTTKDQDPIVGTGEVPILGIDMWEHAYYLQVSIIFTGGSWNLELG